MYTISIMEPLFSDLDTEKGKRIEPIVEGIFYPDTPQILQKEIKSLFEEAGDTLGNAFAIISPHAALPFSGSVAAKAFKSAGKREIDNIVIISMARREEKEAAFLTESDFYTIPTGDIKINKDIIEKLTAIDPCFEQNDIPHLEEYSIEIQLPFMNYLFPNAQVVPILLGANSKNLIKKTAQALQSVFENKLDKTLFVVSANITGCMPDQEAVATSQNIIKIIESGDIEALYNAMPDDLLRSTGISCAAILLLLSGKNSKVKVIDITDSSIGCKDGNNVYYAAIAIEKN